MTQPLLTLGLIGACIAIADGVATFPRKARDMFAAALPKPEAEAQVLALARAEIAATKRGDLLSAARYAEQREATHVS